MMLQIAKEGSWKQIERCKECHIRVYDTMVLNHVYPNCGNDGMITGSGTYYITRRYI